MTNAVLSASQLLIVTLLPYLSTFCQELRLPVALPITEDQVYRWHAYSEGDGSSIVVLRLKSNYSFRIKNGYVDYLHAPHNYSNLQDPSRIKDYFGPLNMSRDEAVAFARNALTRLGYPLSLLYADLDPDVLNPPHLKEGVVPLYSVSWPMLSTGQSSVSIDIDAERKQVVGLMIENRNARLMAPKLNLPVEPFKPVPTFGQPLTGTEATNALALSLKNVGSFGSQIGMLSDSMLTTNDLKEVAIKKIFHVASVRGVLKSGCEFDFKKNLEIGLRASDLFFDSPDDIVLLKDYIGTNHMTDSQVIKLCKDTLRKLGIPPGLLKKSDFKLERPPLKKPSIPRVNLTWQMKNGSWIGMEVESEHKVVKAVSVWGSDLMAMMHLDQ